MKDKRLVSKIDKISPKSVVLWGAFVAAVLAGLDGVRWAALAGFKSENGEVGSKPGEMATSDPFVLMPAAVRGQSQDSPPANMSQDTTSGRVLKWPAIRIPQRPALRSPFQPPLVPETTSSGSAGLAPPKEATAGKPAI